MSTLITVNFTGDQAKQVAALQKIFETDLTAELGEPVKYENSTPGEIKFKTNVGREDVQAGINSLHLEAGYSCNLSVAG